VKFLAVSFGLFFHSGLPVHLATQAVYALQSGQGYIPFRQGKASILLKESLGGNCKTVVIICVWPEECFLDEMVLTMPIPSRKNNLIKGGNPFLTT